MKAAALMVGYAVLMLAGGTWAYASAPPGANAATALIVPAAVAVVMLVCAAMAALLARQRTVGMIGIHLGLVLPLLFAGAIGWRASAATQAVQDYRAGEALFRAAVAEGRVASDTPEARATFLAGQAIDGRKVPDHDKTYLRNALWVLAGLSLVTFGALLLARPKPAARGAATHG